MTKLRTFEILASAGKESARAAFERRVAQLPEMVGQRNRALPGLCRLGLRGGLDDDAICAIITQGSGYPPLGADEVRRALATVKGTPPPDGQFRPHIIICGPEEKAFVGNAIAIGRGTTVRGLQKSCWVMPTALNPRKAMVRQVDAMCGWHGDLTRTRFDPFSDQWWLGTDKREGDFHPAFGIGFGHHLRQVPNFITCNAMTGKEAPKKSGKGMTLRGDNCVVTPKLMLVEFDAMPITKHLAWVGGVMKTGAFKVVSVVWSGGKSLHTLVEAEGEYEAFKEKVLRLCCSSDDPRERCDRAVLHPSALTRLAGARRENGNVQELVWYRTGIPIK